MSVITHYETRIVDSGAKHINLRDELINKGVLTMTDDTHGVLDKDLACHEDWLQDLAKMKEDGVQTLNSPSDYFDENGTIKSSAVDSYARRFKSSSNVSSEQLSQEASDYYNSFKKMDSSNWYRRDLLPIEIEQAAKTNVEFSADGQTMSYFRNHSPNDDSPIYYANKALPDAVFESTVCTEGHLDTHFYSKNGEPSTPSGKDFGAVLDVNDKSIKTQDGSKQSKVFLHLGEKQEKALIYVNAENGNDIVPSLRQGRSLVFFPAGKNITVYNLGNKDNPKSFLSPSELMESHKEAKLAYRHQMDEARKAKQSPSKDAYFHQLDSKAESKDSSYALPDIDVNEDDYPF